MERLIKTLESVDTETIKSEVNNQKLKNSPTLNKALKREYTNFPKDLNSKTLLLKIWNFTVVESGKPREGTISRIWLRLYKSLHRIIKALYDNENTKEGTCTEFRKVVRAKYGDNSEIYKQSIYNLGVSQKRSKERKLEYAARVKVRNAARAELQPIYVEDILSVIQKLKKSNDPYEQAIRR